MILNLAPVRAYHLDTLTSLNFANRTKKIEIREAENEPIYKGPPRPAITIGGSSIQRQALRPLTTAHHNVNVRGPMDANDSEKSQKPAKAFSVYSDKSRSMLIARPAVTKRSSPLKRTSDHLSTIGRLSVRTASSAITQSAIEDMVEKKVAKILAARALDQPATPMKDISEDVRKRLEHLERKIEGQDDERAEGLTFLLMAKQHHARGEDSSALKMYQLAKEHFPNNQKLEAKIQKIKLEIQETKDSRLLGSTIVSKAPVHQSLPASKSIKRDHHIEKEEVDDYRPSDVDYNSDSDTFVRPIKPRKQRRLNPKAMISDSEDILQQTPRTKRLLSIMNSRDVDQIRLLKGVGSKKAGAIVEAVCTLGENGEDEDAPSVRTLGQLGRLRGMGSKTVDNWRTGLGVGVDLV